MLHMYEKEINLTLYRSCQNFYKKLWHLCHQILWVLVSNWFWVQGHLCVLWTVTAVQLTSPDDDDARVHRPVAVHSSCITLWWWHSYVHQTVQSVTRHFKLVNLMTVVLLYPGRYEAFNFMVAVHLAANCSAVCHPELVQNLILTAYQT